jgi:hypothetical protein
MKSDSVTDIDIVWFFTFYIDHAGRHSKDPPKEIVDVLSLPQLPPFEPSETQLRKKSKLGTQREEIEPEVTSIQTDPSKEVEIRHTPPIRGGFAELQKKGLRIKDYRTTEKE